MMTIVDTGETLITVKTIINLTVDKVWEYWTLPEHITRWNNASDDWHTPHAENDFRIGGSFFYRMENKDGSAGFDYGGVYDNIILNELIEFTIGDGRKVKITFITDGIKTEIVERFEAETEYAFEMQKQGWQSILDNFKKYAEANN